MADRTDIPLFYSNDIIARYNIKDRLSEYIDAALEYNRKVNIVSRETSRPDLLRIAADSLIPFEFGAKLGGRFFDIGSGGGFPAIVILLAFPDAEAVLFERTGKKARFLEEITRALGLRAEIASRDFGEVYAIFKNKSFDSGTMKLVRPERRLMRGAHRLVRRGGNFIYYGGPERYDPSISDFAKNPSFRYYLDENKQLRSLTIFS